MGFFDKIKQGLKKTSDLLNTDVRDLFKSQGRLIDEAFLEELTAVLIKTDMGVVAAQAIVDTFGSMGETATVGAIFVFTTLLTQVLSNNAAAAIMTPLAYQTGVAFPDATTRPAGTSSKSRFRPSPTP